jgi:lysophospholipase L1-like esterase
MKNLKHARLFVLTAVGLLLAGCATPPPIPVVPTTVKAITPESRNGEAWWKARHEAMNQTAQKGGFKLMFIGDSITQGWEGAGKDVWAKELAPFTAANFGISGDRTENVLWRLANGNLDGAIDPKVIIIMIGTNNTGHRKDKPEEIAAGVGAIITKLHERFPEADVLLLGVFPRGPDAKDALRQNNDAVNALLAKFDGHWDVHYLDIGPKLMEKDGTLSRDIMPDLLHLSAKGYQIWADAIVPEIKEMLD